MIRFPSHSRIFPAAVAVVFLVGCAPAPPPPSSSHDAPLPPWYAHSIDQLVALNRDADNLFQTGKSDDAAAKIKEAQSVVARLLSVPVPTLPAVEAASDLDDLYGRMLFANRNYGWAEMFFQKNRSRWKHWSPQTPESARRLKQAETAIEECNKKM